MSPEFSNQALSDHDLLQETHAGVKFLTEQFEDLKNGKLGVCVAHTQRIDVVEKRLDSWGSRGWALLVLFLGSMATSVWAWLKH